MQVGEPESKSSATPSQPTSLVERHPDLPHGVQEPPPKFPPGLRTVFYLFSTLSLQSIAMSVLALWVFGPEKLEALAQGDPSVSVSLGDQILLRALAAPAVLILTLLFVHTIDRKRPEQIGLWPLGEEISNLARKLLAMGAAAIGLLIAWRFLAGLTVDFAPASELPLAGEPSVGLPLMVLLAYGVGFLLLALLEEVMFRGYIYSAVREQFAWIHSAGWTSLLFVFLHIGNPDINAVGILNTCLFGLLLGALREWDGHIWGAALFHATWNFVLGCLLALPISGMRVPSVRAIEAQGPETLSGGAYGPEGSWILTPLLIALILAVAWQLQQRGLRLQPPEDPSEASHD